MSKTADEGRAFVNPEYIKRIPFFVRCDHATEESCEYIAQEYQSFYAAAEG